MPLIPEEQEAQVRTDEQAGTSAQQLSRAEKTFDPNNPQVDQGYSAGADKKVNTVYHEEAQLREEEQAEPQKSVHRAYPKDV